MVKCVWFILCTNSDWMPCAFAALQVLPIYAKMRILLVRTYQPTWNSNPLLSKHGVHAAYSVVSISSCLLALWGSFIHLLNFDSCGVKCITNNVTQVTNCCYKEPGFVVCILMGKCSKMTFPLPRNTLYSQRSKLPRIVSLFGNFRKPTLYNMWHLFHNKQVGNQYFGPKPNETWPRFKIAMLNWIIN